MSSAEPQRPLTERELEQLRRLLSDPFNYPPDLWKWIKSQAENDPPGLTWDAIIGFQQAVERFAPGVGPDTITDVEIAPGTITNTEISASAAIAKSKLAPLAIVNADIDAAAAIAKSKLAALAIVNADIDAAAAIAKSKLAPLAIVNADVDAAAAIARTKIAGISIATTLPASPTNGQEAILVDSLTEPQYVWAFRYETSITADAYKWIFLGGSPLENYRAAAETRAAATYAGLTSAQTITVPRAGIYIVSVDFQAYSTSAGAFPYMSYDGAGVTAADSRGASGYTSTTSTTLAALSMQRRETLTAATLTAMFRGHDGGGITTTFSNRRLAIIPVRVS